MLSIVIPVYNEQEILSRQKEDFHRLGRAGQLIFVDGGSRDRTGDVAGDYGQVIPSERGRGLQKNRGADAAEHDILLFLHVDTRLPEDASGLIERAVAEGSQAGCFRLKVDDPRWCFRFFEWMVNIRAKQFGVIDGDTGFFIDRAVFQKTGGFDPMPYMEDILFSRKLRRLCVKVQVLDSRVLASSRKWREGGFWKTLWRYTLAYIKIWTGRTL